MAIGIIGKKIGMTQVYIDEGKVVPVTVVEAGPCTIVDIKTKESNGYNALKLGFAETKEKTLNKPEIGYLKKQNSSFKKHLKEFRLETTEGYEVGQELNADVFEVLQYVDVTGISKGKGFQGGMKRWNWNGGPKTHGSNSHRRPGSIGASADPSRVLKGHHLPGRMGGDKKTIQNLEVVKILLEENLIAIKGAIPGSNGSIVYITKAIKREKRIILSAEERKKKGSGAKKTIKRKK